MNRNFLTCRTGLSIGHHRGIPLGKNGKQLDGFGVVDFRKDVDGMSIDRNRSRY